MSDPNDMGVMSESYSRMLEVQKPPETTCARCNGERSVRNSREEARVVGEDFSDCPDCTATEDSATREANDMSVVCETCHHLGVTPEGWCLDCDWRTNGIKVMSAYRALRTDSGVTITEDEKQALTHGWLSLERCARVEQEGPYKDKNIAYLNECAETLRSLAARLSKGERGK
jgi:hypothetical protein